MTKVAVYIEIMTNMTCVLVWGYEWFQWDLGCLAGLQNEANLQEENTT